MATALDVQIEKNVEQEKKFNDMKLIDESTKPLEQDRDRVSSSPSNNNNGPVHNPQDMDDSLRPNSEFISETTNYSLDSTTTTTTTTTGDLNLISTPVNGGKKLTNGAGSGSGGSGLMVAFLNKLKPNRWRKKEQTTTANSKNTSLNSPPSSGHNRAGTNSIDCSIGSKNSVNSANQQNWSSLFMFNNSLDIKSKTKTGKLKKPKKLNSDYSIIDNNNVNTNANNNNNNNNFTNTGKKNSKQKANKNSSNLTTGEMANNSNINNNESTPLKNLTNDTKLIQNTEALLLAASTNVTSTPSNTITTNLHSNLLDTPILKATNNNPLTVNVNNSSSLKGALNLADNDGNKFVFFFL